MPLKVYYLDDEKDLLEVFVDTFSNDRIVIVPFGDVSELVRKARAEPPDLLFLDYRLPGITGPEVAAMLDPAIPKVLMTGDLIVVGAEAFKATFTKPFEIENVRKLLNDYCKG